LGELGHNPFRQFQGRVLERGLGCRLFRNVHSNAGLAIHREDFPAPGLGLELDPGFARNEVAFPRPKRAESLPGHFHLGAFFRFVIDQRAAVFALYDHDQQAIL